VIKCVLTARVPAFSAFADFTIMEAGPSIGKGIAQDAIEGSGQTRPPPACPPGSAPNSYYWLAYGFPERPLSVSGRSEVHQPRS
jgi:hypothetical protein